MKHRVTTKSQSSIHSERCFEVPILARRARVGRGSPTRTRGSSVGAGAEHDSGERRQLKDIVWKTKAERLNGEQSTLSSFDLYFHAVFLQLTIERTPIYAQCSSGLNMVSSTSIKHR